MAHDRRIALAAAIGLVVTWASAFAAIREALVAYAPIEVAFARIAVASVAFAVAAPLVGYRRPSRSDLVRLAVAGALGMAAYHVLLNLGETQVNAATASLLIATVPVFTAVLAVGFLGERVSSRRWLGIAVAAIGAFVVILQGSGTVRLEPAALFVLAAAACAAGYVIIQKPALDRVTPIEATAYATWFATLLLLPGAVGLPSSLAGADLSATLSLVWLGIVPSAIGYALFAFTLERLDASAATVFLYLIPPVAALIAWVWLGETVGLFTVVGGAIALAGVAVASRPGSRRGAPTIH